MGSILAVGAIFLCCDHGPVQALHCMVLEAALCMHEYVCSLPVYIYLSITIKRLIIPGGEQV